LKEAIELATKVDAGTNSNFFWTATPLGDDGIINSVIKNFGTFVYSTNTTQSYIYYLYQTFIDGGTRLHNVVNYQPFLNQPIDFNFNGLYYVWVPSTGEWTWRSANSPTYCRCVR